MTVYVSLKYSRLYLRHDVRRYIHTYIQTRLTFYTSMWGSLRLAPIMLKIMYYVCSRQVSSLTLQNYTHSRSCVEMCITVYGKRKEELVAAFMETPATEVDVDERADKTIAGAEPVELVGIMMQM